MRFQIDSMTKAYGDTIVLDRVSAQWEGPGVIGLVGRNGAGKSTLLRLLAGVEWPDEGSARCDDLDLLADETTWRAHVGYLPQSPVVCDEMTPEEMMRWSARLHGIREGEEAIERALSRADLVERRGAPIRELSEGMKRRFGVSLALLHSPKVVLLDEPFASLDPAQMARIRGVIEEVSEETLVLLSSHDLSHLARLSSEVWVVAETTLVRGPAPTSEDFVDGIEEMIETRRREK